MTAPDESVKENGGRSQGFWSDVERSLFEQGVIAHGWGNWAAMVRASIIPTHNQK
jgi:hypothetical protein